MSPCSACPPVTFHSLSISSGESTCRPSTAARKLGACSVTVSITISANRAGRVTVNGRRVHTLPVLVDPESDEIVIDGRPLRPERKVYFLLHKPKGVHCTNFDPDGRPRAVDLLGGVNERVFPVGRLDADSEVPTFSETVEIALPSAP